MGHPGRLYENSQGSKIELQTGNGPMRKGLGSRAACGTKSLCYRLFSATVAVLLFALCMIWVLGGFVLGFDFYCTAQEEHEFSGE